MKRKAMSVNSKISKIERLFNVTFKLEDNQYEITSSRGKHILTLKSTYVKQQNIERLFEHISNMLTIASLAG